MRLKYLLTGVLLCVGWMAFSHPLHLTFTNLEFNTQKSRWVITLKVFSDDFASNLKMATGKDLGPEKSRKNSETEKILLFQVMRLKESKPNRAIVY